MPEGSIFSQMPSSGLTTQDVLSPSVSPGGGGVLGVQGVAEALGDGDEGQGALRLCQPAQCCVLISANENRQAVSLCEEHATAEALSDVRTSRGKVVTVHWGKYSWYVKACKGILPRQPLGCRLTEAMCKT